MKSLKRPLLLIKHAFFIKDGPKRTARVAWKVGIKLPTGDENKSPALGSGSDEEKYYNFD